MQLIIQDIDLNLIPLDTERLLVLKVVLENGQIFDINEDDGALYVHATGMSKSLIIAPEASNAVRIRADR